MKKECTSVSGWGRDDECGELEKLRYSRVRLRSKIAIIAGEVPV